MLCGGDGTVRVDEGGDLVISPLTAEDVPAEAVSLKAELTEKAAVRADRVAADRVDRGMVCAGRDPARGESGDHRPPAVAADHGVRRGNAVLKRWTAVPGARQVDYGAEMVIHGGRVLSTYTHVTDQHATYGTKIIVATKREAHYVLDEILGNATDLPITEHATDTHGVTLVKLRAVRPARDAALTPDSGPRKDRLVPARTPPRHRGPVPACRTVDDPPCQPRADR